MITITYSERSPMSIEAKGHASGAGDPGKNLVCCAISTLMYTIMEAADELHIYAESKMDDGYAYIVLLPRGQRYEAANILYETIMTGLRHLAEQYPEFILMRKENKKNG